MNELTGQFPADWELLRLPEVLFFQEGPGITSDKFTKEGIPFINIRCFVNGRIDRSSCQFISQKLGNGEYKHFQLDVNDWVFSSSGTIGKIALIFDEDLPLLLNTSTIRFRTQDEKRLANNYIKFFLESFHFKIQHQLQTQGSAQVNVGPTHLQKMHIPLPPIKEQTQIATILSTIDRAIEQTEALIAKQQRIKTGLMQDLLTKGIDENGNIRSEETHEFKDSPLGRIPVEWEVEYCSAICKEIVVGIVIRPAQYYKPSGVPVLRSANVRENIIDTSDMVYMSERDNIALNKSRLSVGDLVTVRTGYPGNTAVITPELDGSNCVDIVISRPDSRRVRSNYLALWINSNFGKKQILEGQGGLAQQHFNVGEVRKLLVKVPSINEQIRIEDLLLLQGREVFKLQSQLQKLKLQKTGLMQDLLTGKVRVTELIKERETDNL
jgi:type I restriction enzyme S subunit